VSKFREIRAQRREEVETQRRLFMAVFDSQFPISPKPGRERDTLRAVMWAGWRACAYTNGIITEPKRDVAPADGSQS